ncbi:MAG: DMT family transporter [Candidatus Eremiobacteraeota bacterium]|nr:DMT family transporter [Candidatus Eremiobacteraeota bacterium]
MSRAERGGLAAAIAIFYVFLWASAYVPSKIASVESQPLWFLVARFLAAGTLLAVLAIALRRPFPANAREWFVACALGLLANTLYLGLTYLAMRRLSAGMGAILASTNPLVLGLLAPRLLGERLTRLKVAGLVLGFGGVAAVVLGRGGSQSALPLDVALAFAGVLSGVASTLLFKRSAGGQSLIALTAVQMFFAGVMMVPFAAAISGAPRLVLTPELIASFWYLVLVLSVGASLIWFWLLTKGEASRVSAFYYLTPVFGLGLSALFLREPVSWHDAVGLAAIALGIALVQRS